MRDTENRVITIPLDKGMDQRKPPHLSPVGTFDTVQNLRVCETGLLRKRPGTRAIGSSSLTSANPPLVGAGTATSPVYQPCFLATVGGSVGIFGHTSGTVFAHNEQNDTFYQSGQFSTCEPIRRRYGIMGRELGDSASVGSGCPTVVTLADGGYILVAAITEGDSLFAYIETTAGTRVFVKRSALTATNTQLRARAVSVGASFYLFWTSNQTLFVQQLTPAGDSVTAGVETTISSALLAETYFDVCTLSGALIFLAYQINTGVLRLQAGIGGTTVDFSVTDLTPCSVYADSTQGNVYLGWHDDVGGAANVYYAIRLASDITTVVRAPTVLAASSRYGPPLFGPYWENPTTTVLWVCRDITSTTRGMIYGRAYVSGSADDPKTLSGVYPISKPDSAQRVWVADDIRGQTFCRTMLIRLLDGGRNASAIFAPQLSVELASPRHLAQDRDDTPWSDAGFFNLPSTAGDTTFFAFTMAIAQRNGASLGRVEVYEYRSRLDVNVTKEVAPLGATTVISGQPTEVFSCPFPQLSSSLGTVPTMRLAGAAEIGFAETPAIVVTSAAGTELEAGTYLYRGVIEWVDMYGRRHQSAPSDVRDLELTAAGRGSITVRLRQSTQRIATQGQLTAPYAVLYRSLRNGTTLHRLPGAAEPGVAYEDDATDDDIADEEILYTEGGVLANVLAPSCQFTRYVGGRLWCGGLWDPEIIECSKLAVPLEQIAFTGDATHQVVLDGPCTGLAVLDDQLVVFTETSISAVVGDGPNDQGIGAFAVRSVARGIGCANHRSVLETDAGVLFQSGLGWHMLPRGFGTPVYVGEFFQDVESSYPNCLGVAARHSSSGHLALLLLADELGTSQRVVVFDLVSGQWTVDTYPVTFGCIGAWPDALAFCKSTLSGSPIYLEDEDETGDNGTHITATIRTNWIKPSGPAGWGQFKTIGSVVQPITSAQGQTISMSVQVDGNTAETLPASVSTGISTDPSYRYITPISQRGTGLLVTLADAAVGGSPASGFQWVALAVEYFPDGGIRPPQPGER